MQKTILITGATDGIGLETAKILAEQKHKLLIHGRNTDKLQQVQHNLSLLGAQVETYQADLSILKDVKKLYQQILTNHTHLDVLINNAGILKTANSRTEDGLDIRFAVNTIAPYLLTQKLLPLFNATGRIINLSSAAQSPVDLLALSGELEVAVDLQAYAQSKLAITAWSRKLGNDHKASGPIVLSINPGSLLGTKMVTEGFHIPGKDIHIGANILVEAALSERFQSAHGLYFDNDAEQFTTPHHDVLNDTKTAELVGCIEEIIRDLA